VPVIRVKAMPLSPFLIDKQMRLLASLCMALLAVSAAAVHAEIYACTSKKGMTVYQNFTCDVDSIGSTATGATNNSAPAPSSSSAIRAALKPVSHQDPVPATTRNGSAEPRIGMSTNDVKVLWGEPESSYQDELVDGRVEIWSYGGSRAVRFDPRGRVVLVEH
jgi:hypothetical protein